jgi:hypothetical protein
MFHEKTKEDVPTAKLIIDSTRKAGAVLYIIGSLRN